MFLNEYEYCLAESILNRKDTKKTRFPLLFSYTGTGQSFTIPAAGTYCFECWGAQGGIFTTAGDNRAGMGGYTKGLISLPKNELLFVFVGHQGYSNRTGNGNWNEGGYNGGGYSGSTTISYSAGGGGSTDIRIKGSTSSNSVPAWNNSVSLNNRIMVAGGGGGSGYYSGYGLIGGGGGGVNGGVGKCSTGMYPDLPGATQYGSSSSQTANSKGYFGYADQNGELSSFGGGGGGGYWGGTKGHGNGGSGGSSYISGHAGCEARASETATTNKTGTANTIAKSTHWSGKIFTASSIVMIDGDGYRWTTTKGTLINVPLTDLYDTTNREAVNHGHTGNGFARITQISVD